MLNPQSCQLLADFLAQTAEGELEIEAARELFIESYGEHLSTIFNTIKEQGTSEITYKDLIKYLLDSGLEFNDTDVELFFEFYGSPENGHIRFEDFLRFLLPLTDNTPKEIKFKYASPYQNPSLTKTSRLEPFYWAFSRILLRELQLLDIISKYKKLLITLEDWELKAAFDLIRIDYEKAISDLGLVYFFRRFGYDFTVSVCQRLIKRFDKNKNGVLEYSEFVEIFFELKRYSRIVMRASPRKDANSNRNSPIKLQEVTSWTTPLIRSNFGDSSADFQNLGDKAALDALQDRNNGLLEKLFVKEYAKGNENLDHGQNERQFSFGDETRTNWNRRESTKDFSQSESIGRFSSPQNKKTFSMLLNDTPNHSSKFQSDSSMQKAQYNQQPLSQSAGIFKESKTYEQLTREKPLLKLSQIESTISQSPQISPRKDSSSSLKGRGSNRSRLSVALIDYKSAAGELSPTRYSPGSPHLSFRSQSQRFDEASMQSARLLEETDKVRLIMRQFLDIELELEDLRKELAMQEDFTPYTLYKHILEETGSNSLNKETLAAFLLKMGISMDRVELRLLFNRFDQDCDGQISLKDFEYQLYSTDESFITPVLARKKMSKILTEHTLALFERFLIRLVRHDHCIEEIRNLATNRPRISLQEVVNGLDHSEREDFGYKELKKVVDSLRLQKPQRALQSEAGSRTSNTSKFIEK